MPCREIGSGLEFVWYFEQNHSIKVIFWAVSKMFLPSSEFSMLKLCSLLWANNGTNHMEMGCSSACKYTWVDDRKLRSYLDTCLWHFNFHFSSRVGVPGKSDGVIFTPVKTEIVSFAPELVGGKDSLFCFLVMLTLAKLVAIKIYSLWCVF